MSIDTARFNEVTAIESLSPVQKNAVYKLRRFSNNQKVSPYTVGILVLRDSAKLEKLTDGRRLTKLSPATREILIAEAREAVYPFEPAVVAVWSAWAASNNVLCSPVDEENALLAAVSKEVKAHLEHKKPYDVAPKPKVRGYDKGARERGKVYLAGALADGKEHDSRTVRAGTDVKVNALLRAAHELGVVIRVDYNSGVPGKASFWSLPHVSPVMRGPGQTTSTAGRSMRRVHVEHEHTGGSVALGMRGPQHNLVKDQAARRVQRLARKVGVSATVLARWADVKIAPNGTPYGAGPRTVLPDRESDQGIELADEVFVAALPLAPETAARRVLARG